MTDSTRFSTVAEVQAAIAAGRTDFSNCVFSCEFNGNVAPVIHFSGLNLSNALFEQPVSHSRFNGANLSGAVFSQAVDECDFQSTTLADVRFRGPFSNGNLRLATLERVAFDDAFFNNDLNGARNLTDVTFSGVAGSNDFGGSRLHHVQFFGPVTGNNFAVTVWDGISFSNSIINYNEFGPAFSAAHTTTSNSFMVDNHYALPELERDAAALTTITEPFSLTKDFIAGDLPTSGLLSAVSALQQTPEGERYLNQHTVQYDPATQQFAVRFDGIRPPEGVVIHLSYEEALAYNGARGSIGVTVLEAAWAKLVNDPQYKGDLAATTPWLFEKAGLMIAPDRAAPLIDPFYALTGHHADAISMENIRDYAAQPGHENSVYTASRGVFLGQEGISLFNSQVNDASVEGVGQFPNFQAMNITLSEDGIIATGPHQTSQPMELSDAQAAEVFDNGPINREVYAFDLDWIASALADSGASAAVEANSTNASPDATAFNTRASELEI